MRKICVFKTNNGGTTLKISQKNHKMIIFLAFLQKNHRLRIQQKLFYATIENYQTNYQP